MASSTGERQADVRSGGVPVRVAVRGVDGHRHEGRAQVLLQRGDDRVELEWSERSGRYEGRVPPGAYGLSASAGLLVAPERKLVVEAEGKSTTVHLGEEGWPSYRLGEHVVPFPPPGNLLAVAFPERKPDRGEAETLVRDTFDDASVEPCSLSQARREQRIAPEVRSERFNDDAEGMHDDFVVAQGAVWLLRAGDGPGVQQRDDVLTRVKERLGRETRVGIPVDLHSDQVRVMDGRFIVRFREQVNREQVERLVTDADARILRETFPQAPNTFLIEFSSPDYREHLDAVERWHEDGLLVYGEPDLMAEIVDDQFPNDPPDDPTYPSQANLSLQKVPEAWEALHAIDKDLTLGSPAVHVMTLDRGVQLDHPDVGADLTDGSGQIARCFDFSSMRECNAPDYAPETGHGMGVYGIIAAHTDNGVAIAGIAPNTHQIGLLRPNLTSERYPDVLLWAAGFTTGNDHPDWPDEPLEPGAAIISCSHGSNNLPLSGIMDDTLRTLAAEGRDGRGTLTIYSAGNGDEDIDGVRTWAAHPETMAIANSQLPDADGVEQKVGSSNRGSEIDVCAQGQGAPSLDPNGGEQTFGGTSAAAPTVAAAAALVLSRHPNLTAGALRHRLRVTAEKIDPHNTDPDGRWEDASGRTAEDAGYEGPHFSKFYGYGRIDVHRAVTAVFLRTARGKVNFLRVHRVRGFGPPHDHIPVHVVAQVDTADELRFGFPLEAGDDRLVHEHWLDVLRTAYRSDRRVRIEYEFTGGRNEIMRNLELLA